jgi:cyclopropane fatty-acyl-phospholipid synthase-like methyltransferase
MSMLDEKIAKSLTAESVELIPYITYLLQDLWELGSSPKDMLGLIKKNIAVTKETKVLDLACGKGAVSVYIAKELGCKVKGIDIIPEFIDFAVSKAKEFGVNRLCDFIVQDINESVKKEKDYDIVIYGAVGNVLGDWYETISLLKNTVKEGGFIIIDDAYGKNEADDKYLSKDKWLRLLADGGVVLIDEILSTDDELAGINDMQMESIEKRANELKKKFPEKACLFDSYIKSRQAECDEIEEDLMPVTMLLQVR